MGITTGQTSSGVGSPPSITPRGMDAGGALRHAGRPAPQGGLVPRVEAMPTMTLIELLRGLYAPLRGLSDRSVALYSGTIDRFREHLEREPLVSDLTDLTVARFLAARSRATRAGRAISPATVRKDQAQLQSLATFAAKRGLAQSWLTVAGVRVPRKIPSAYTAEDIGRLVAVGGRRRGRVGPVPARWFWPTLLRTCFYTGERITSVLSLTWGDIDFDRRVILFPGERRKGGVADILREIPADLAASLLERRGDPGAAVFPWLGHRVANSIYNSLRDLARQAGVKPRGFHGLRKSAASYVAAAGGNATQFLAHENPRLAARHYVDPRIAGMPSVLGMLPSLDGPPATDPPATVPFPRRRA